MTKKKKFFSEKMSSWSAKNCSFLSSE